MWINDKTLFSVIQWEWMVSILILFRCIDVNIFEIWICVMLKNMKVEVLSNPVDENDKIYSEIKKWSECCDPSLCPQWGHEFESWQQQYQQRIAKEL